MKHTQILYPRLRELLDEGAQLVEVLPPAEYQELHLPGALSIPLKTLDAQTTAELDRGRAVVVYCWDGLCDMSPRAACRLATLGFQQVYDYMPSKVDWMARGLPLEGEKAGDPRAIDVARADVVSCGLQDTIGNVRDRIARSPHGFAFVLSPDGVLLGRLRKAALERSPDAQVQDVMEPGPSTTRPDIRPDKLLAKLQQADLATAVLTDPDGRPLGVVSRTDLERRAS
jgi:rhodanese-related sulfurtransferase/CBS domain-containing protein